MNEKWFLPFMVLLGDEGNKFAPKSKGNGCSGCGCLVVVVIALLFLSIWLSTAH
jgi:hypothetical protein